MDLETESNYELELNYSQKEFNNQLVNVINLRLKDNNIEFYLKKNDEGNLCIFGDKSFINHFQKIFSKINPNMDFLFNFMIPFFIPVYLTIDVDNYKMDEILIANNQFNLNNINLSNQQLNPNLLGMFSGMDLNNLMQNKPNLETSNSNNMNLMNMFSDMNLNNLMQNKPNLEDNKILNANENIIDDIDDVDDDLNDYIHSNDDDDNNSNEIDEFEYGVEETKGEIEDKIKDIVGIMPLDDDIDQIMGKNQDNIMKLFLDDPNIMNNFNNILQNQSMMTGIMGELGVIEESENNNVNLFTNLKDVWSNDFYDNLNNDKDDDLDDFIIDEVKDKKVDLSRYLKQDNQNIVFEICLINFTNYDEKIDIINKYFSKEYFNILLEMYENNENLHSFPNLIRTVCIDENNDKYLKVYFKNDENKKIYIKYNDVEKIKDIVLHIVDLSKND